MNNNTLCKFIPLINVSLFSNSFQNMTELNENNLVKELDHLRSLIESPRLLMSNFFIDLRSQVDLEFVKEQLIITDNNETLVLNKNWDKIIKRIEAFESNCFRKLPSNIKVDQNKLKTVESYEKRLLNKESDQFRDLIYDEAYNIEKNLFQNQTILFLEKKNSLVSKESISGQLLVIKHAFFSQKGKELLNSDDLKKLHVTNELLKCIVLKEKIKGSAEPILEIELDFSEIPSINLYNSSVSTICVKTFVGFDNMSQVWISRNLLQTLNEPIFSNCLNLKEIGLAWNQINSIHPQLFNTLKCLTSIDLSGNKLESLDKNIFKGLFDLNNIDLQSNKFRSFDESLFNGLTNLKRLNLSNNKLTQISQNLFESLINLEMIDLSRNSLTSVDSIKSAKQLRIIRLADNKLTQIDNALLVDLNWVTEIYLENNCIKSIEYNALNGLKQLQLLSLNNNELASLDVGLFQGLTEMGKIDLSANKLKNIDINIFNSLDKLYYVGLLYMDIKPIETNGLPIYM